MKRALVFLCAAAAAAWLAWFAPRHVAAGAANDAALPAPPATAVRPPASAPTEAIALPTGALEVVLVWRDIREPASGIGLSLRPLDDAAVEFEPLERVTDAGGRAHFEHVPAGDLAIETDRGTRDFGLVRVGRGSTKTVLLDRGVEVRGRVLAPSGEPVAGAEVWLTRSAGFVDGRTVTVSAADGSFSIAGVVPGERFVGARDARFAPSESIAIAAPEPNPLELELVLAEPAGAVAGFVHDAYGVAVERASVVIVASDTNDASRTGDASRSGTRTDRDGRFALAGLPVGPSWLEVGARGRLSTFARVDVQSGERAELDLELERGATLAGIVHASNGKPARGARVACRSSADATTRHAIAALDGSFRIEGLPRGPTELCADWNEQESAEGELEIASDDARWEPTLARGRAIAGILLDARGEPVAGATIELEREAGGGALSLRAARTDARGRFRVPCCPDRPHRLTAFPAGSRAFALCTREGVRPGERELELRVDDELAPSARIVGRVQSVAGALAADASLAAIDDERERVLCAPLASDGSFSLGPLPPGEWRVALTSDGFAPTVRGERRLEAGAVWDVGTLTLSRGETLGVRYTKPPELAAEPMFVAKSADGAVVEWLHADGGFASTRPLAPGVYRLEAGGCDGFAAQSLEVELGRGGAELSLALSRGVPCSFHIRAAPGGDGTCKATLAVFTGSAERVFERTLAFRGRGTYEFEACLAPGPYRYELHAAGRTSTVGTFVVAEGSPGTSLDVTME
jgi:hypothetical protein